MRIENSITQDNCLASLGKPRDAEHLLLWRNFNLHLITIKDSYIPILVDCYSLVWWKHKFRGRPFFMNTIMILSFRTDRHGQTVQTKIREEQSDQVYTVCNSICIFKMHHYCMVEPGCSNFRVITANFSDVQIFRIFTYITEYGTHDHVSGWHFTNDKQLIV